MAEELLGKPLVNVLKESLKIRIAKLNQQGIFPKVVGLYCADDTPSKHYFKNNARLANNLGMSYELLSFSSEVTTADVIQQIESLNNDQSVHGIMIGLPLPDSLDQEVIINHIAVDKDIDGQIHENLGCLMAQHSGLIPNTPRAVIALLKHYRIPIAGKHAVVIGRSPLVGKVLSLLLLNDDATVTIAHSKSEDLKLITQQADILCVAAGHPGLITGDMIKPGATVIDIGTTYDDQGKIQGDVATSGVEEVAGALSPVPGGVGPVTNVMMIDQLVERLERGHG